MMIWPVWRTVSCHLSNLDLILDQLMFKAGELELFTRYIEAMDHIQNRCIVACNREENQLLAEEVGWIQFIIIMIKISGCL